MMVSRQWLTGRERQIPDRSAANRVVIAQLKALGEFPGCSTEGKTSLEPGELPGLTTQSSESRMIKVARVLSIVLNRRD